MKQKNSPSDYITKDYFDNSITQLLKGIRAEITFAIEELSERVDKKLTKFKDEILTTVDPLLQELETRRQEREIASDRNMEFQQQVDNHEKRIKRLEQTRQAA